jgi:carboxyl-terminal processing protease
MQNVSQKAKGIRQPILMGALIGVIIALIFMAGFFAREFVPLPPARVYAQTNGESYPLLDEVQGLLDLHYFREQPSATERQYAAVRGVLSTLGDRFTFLVDPPVAQSESDVLAGTYGGVGVVIQLNEVGDIVMYPFADSPAYVAGIRDGDVLLRIGETAIDLTLGADAIDQMMRGEVRDGNGVNVTVRKLDESELTVFIPFAVVNVPSVVWRVLEEDERIGYLQILRFTARTPEELRTGIAELAAQDVQALVLDVRDNTGGLLQESLWVADEFIDDGVLAYERNRTGEISFRGTSGGVALEYPLVVLVNELTASGAEIVAGAIRDRERGVLIGQNTYGKGTIQSIYPLSDSSSLHVTAAEWLTPARTPLEEVGLEPNIPMIPDENGRDVELGESIRYLRNLLNESGS